MPTWATGSFERPLMTLCRNAMAANQRRVDDVSSVHRCSGAMVGEKRVIHPRSAQRGFSLLELLVVLFIAGLLTSLSVAWLDSGEAPAQQALERLAAASRAQAAEALHAGQIHGLRWNGQRPEFVRQVRDREGLRWQVEAVALGEWPALLRPDWPAAGEPRLVFTLSLIHI